MNRARRLSTSISRIAVTLALVAGWAFPSSTFAGEQWQFELTPYLWGATIGGNVATGGGTPISAPAPGDSSFFTLENLEGAAFLAFEAQRGQWRLMLDGVYVSFADDVRSGPLLTISEKIKGHVFEAAVGYQLAQRPEWELLAGARYFQIENDLDLEPGPRAKSEKTWTDPLIGVRYTRPLSENWQFRARADLGGFGVSADLMQNYVFEFDYRMSDRARLRLGYRYLKADFEKDRFVFDASVKGPAIGVTIDF
jgi:hypothetical protein